MNEAISTKVSFLAGKVSMLYTHKGVSKSSPLPDFFIGHMHLMQSINCLIEISTDFLNYFPKLQMIGLIIEVFEIYSYNTLITKLD